MLLIPSTNIYCVCYVPNTVSDARDTLVDKVCALKELTFSWGDPYLIKKTVAESNKHVKGTKPDNGPERGGRWELLLRGSLGR